MPHRWMLRAVTALAVASLVACSSDTASTADAGEEQGGGGSCASEKNAGNGPLQDSVSPGATKLICYYPVPTDGGYCRVITKQSDIDTFYRDTSNKGAIGCKDAVILTGGDCPTGNVVGKCDNGTVDASRVYYKCSKFADPKANCDAMQGTYTAP